MEKSFGLLFFMRKLKSTAEGELTVYLKITVDKTAVEINTKRHYHPYKWNNAFGRMKCKTDSAREAKMIDAETMSSSKFTSAKRGLNIDDKSIHCNKRIDYTYYWIRYYGNCKIFLVLTR